MPGPCASKYCSRELESEKSGAKFKIWAPYCSRYCGLMMKRNIKPVPIESMCSNCGVAGHNRRTCGRDSKTNKRGDYNWRHNPRPHMPLIPVECDSCGEEFNLRYEDVRKGSQTFCSRQCYWDTTSRKRAGKNSYRDYHMLKNLREYLGGGQEVAGRDIAAMIQNGQRIQANGMSVGSIMKRWCAQGIVEKADGYTYKYVGKGPIGSLIRTANHTQLSKD